MFPGYKLYLTPSSDDTLSPVSEESKHVEDASSKLSVTHETNGDPDSSKAQRQELASIRPHERSIPILFFPVFLSLCLGLWVHFYVHPLNQHGRHGGLSVEAPLSHGDMQQVMGWQKIGNQSLVRTSEEGSQAKDLEDGDELSLRTNDHPRKDMAIRSQWEVARDWLDHVLGWHEWQGYA